jgi:uncharacterized membrane protein
MRKIFKKASVYSPFLLLVSPLLTLAQSVSPGTVPNNITDVGGLLGRVCAIVNVMFTVLMVVAVVIVMYAAYLYLTAGSNPDNVKKASTTILYAAVAIAVGLFSKAIPVAVATFVNNGTNAGGGCS